MAEYNNNTSAWDTQYTYGYDLLDKQGSGGTEFPFYDGMGDVFQTLSASGSYVLSDDISDDFGQHFVAASGTDDLSYKWRASSGYRWDGDGLWAGNHMEPIVEVGARYYIPAMGVFITRDKDLGQRPYEYCYADPVNYVDASGYWPTREGWYWIGADGVATLEVVAGGVGAALALATSPAWGPPVALVALGVAGAAATIAWAYGGDPNPGAPWFTKPLIPPMPPMPPGKVTLVGYAFTASDPAPVVFIPKGGAPFSFGYSYGGDTTQTSAPPAKPSRSDW